MRITKNTLRLASFTLLTAAIGCGDSPYELAPVSGVVTLYGKPLAGATVSFEPRSSGATQIAGPGSFGKSDEQGRFSLRTFKDDEGAVVGSHTVRISTFESRFTDLANSDAVEVVSEEHVPWHYNRNSTLSFDVPGEGTQKADFTLTALERRD